MKIITLPNVLNISYLNKRSSLKYFIRSFYSSFGFCCFCMCKSFSTNVCSNDRDVWKFTDQVYRRHHIYRGFSSTVPPSTSTFRWTVYYIRTSVFFWTFILFLSYLWSLFPSVLSFNFGDLILSHLKFFFSFFYVSFFISFIFRLLIIPTLVLPGVYERVILFYFH